MASAINIALYSPAPQCGKTTIAEYLATKGFTTISFADPLRRMVVSLIVDLGYTQAQAIEFVKNKKNEIIPIIGVTARHLLRTLGTEWGRDCVHPEIWVRSFKVRASRFTLVDCDDLRFPNEHEYLRNLGYQLWYVDSHRDGFVKEVSEHRSDDGLSKGFHFDQVINNDHDLDNLYNIVDQILRHSQEVAA